MTVIRNDGDIAVGLAALLAIDPRLVEIAAVAGPLPLRLAEPGYAGLAHIIVSQMVSRASADAIWRRVVAAAGIPSASSYLALDDVAVAGLGLSRAKAETLRLLARTVEEDRLDLDGLARMEANEALTRLTAMRGIGTWTAEVYLMFCGGHPDVFPAGDVALRAAVGRGLGLEARPDIAAVQQIAAAWKPYRSVLARLFWAYYAVTSGREAAPATK